MSAGDTASNPPPRYAPFNVVASYATQDQAREAAATLQRMGLDSAALEYVSDGSPLAASVRAPVKATDEALMRGLGRRLLVGAVVGVVVGLLVGVLLDVVFSVGSAPAPEIVGALIGVAVGGLLGAFYGGMTTMRRVSGAEGTTRTRSIAVHSDDAVVIDRAVATLQTTNPTHLARFGSDGRVDQV